MSSELAMNLRRDAEQAEEIFLPWPEAYKLAAARIEALGAENARLKEEAKAERLVLKALLDGARSENARLLEALEPFAKAADNFDEFKINDDAEWFAYSGIQRATGSVGAITVADLRAARSAREGGNADG